MNYDDAKANQDTGWYERGAEDMDEPRCSCTRDTTCEDCIAWAQVNGLYPVETFHWSMGKALAVLACGLFWAVVVIGATGWWAK